MTDVFISYDREDRSRIEELAAALGARGWSVWWDRDIRAGEDFEQVISRELQRAGCVIVVWSRMSIGSAWVRDEAAVARQRKVILPIRIDDVEPPLGFRSLHTRDLLGEAGESAAGFERLAADVSAILQGRARGGGEAPGKSAAPQPGSPQQEPTPPSRLEAAMKARRRRRLGIGLGLAALVCALALLALLNSNEPEVPGPAEVVIPPRVADPPASWPEPDDSVAVELSRCRSLWNENQRALAEQPGPALLDAQADCGMRLLEHARITVGETTWSEFTDSIAPVLHRAAEHAQGSRAADLIAHLGWADFLRSKDGAGGLHPPSHYRRALELDADNPYAHVLWGHWILWTLGSLDEARAHFESALSSGRERAFVRRIQISALMNREHDPAVRLEVLRVADEMRRKGEPPPTNDPEQHFWSAYWNIYVQLFLRNTGEERNPILRGLPAKDHLATFRFLLPESEVPADKLDMWVFFLAGLQDHAGERDAARSNYDWVRARQLARGYSTTLLERSEQALARLAGTR